MILLALIVGIPASSCCANDLLPLISKTEELYSIPSGLLWAIATVESGGRQYALNVGGKAVISNSQAEAVKIANSYVKQGLTDIDFGAMQINFRFHGKEFSSIDEMLNPELNIEYAAKFLTKLYKQHGTWQKAVRHYHSGNPKFHVEYSRKVLVSWLKG